MIPQNLILLPTRNRDGGIKPIKGFVNRSFETISWVSVYDCYPGTKIKFFLGIHLRPETSSALIEVKYGIIENETWSILPINWRCIDQATWLKFFDLYIKNDAICYIDLEQCRKLKRQIATLPDGKTPAFNCDLDMYTGDLNKKINECLVSRFLHTWQVKFSIFLLYGDKISLANELNDIASAMSNISDVSYNIKHDKYGNKRRECIEELSGVEVALKAKEDALSKKFEESADAMNLLSEKYGIEIDIDEHCCSKSKLEVM